MKRFDEAIGDYTQAIQLDRNYSKAYYNRGLAYFNLNNMQKACEDFKISLNMGYEAAGKAVTEYCQ
jgi:tetratricopeptide (TPR) repeat protein